MYHSLYKVIPAAVIKKQVGLHVVNTFFALSLASYYVSTYYAPQIQHWPLHLRFFAQKEDTSLINLQVLGNDSPFLFGTLHSISYDGLVSGARNTQNVHTVLNRNGVPTLNIEPNSPQHFPNVSPFNTPPTPENIIVSEMAAKRNLSVKKAGIQDELIPVPSSAYHHTFQPQNVSSVPTVPASPLLSTPTIPLDEPLFLSTTMGHTLMPVSPITLEDIPIRVSPESKIIPSSTVFSKTEDPMLRHVNQLQTQNVSLPNVEAFPSPENTRIEDGSIAPAPGFKLPDSSTRSQDSLLSWKTYMPRVKFPSFLLELCLRILAPGCVDQEEIPFRRALIDTLLSDKFQPHIYSLWTEDDLWAQDNDDKIKGLRRKFFFTYLHAVDWSQTRFERLYKKDAIPDIHTIEEDAFSYAYDFPLKLGIRVYRDEDFPCHPH